VRAEAAERLGQMGRAAAVPLLRSRLADKSAEVRMRVVEALARLPGTPSAVFIEALTDRDELVRICAAEAIDARRSRRAAASLRLLLHDRSPLVRSYAGAALGRIGFRSDRSRLRKMMGRESSDVARLGLYEGLWQLRDRGALDAALQLLNSPEYRVRCATAKALGTTFLSRRNRSRIAVSVRKRLDVETSPAVREALLSTLISVKPSRVRPIGPFRLICVR
jgi:HEAT repeat protein